MPINKKKTSEQPRDHTSAVRATLVGGDHAVAEGISVTSPSPVLDLCRKLVERGYDPALPLNAVRGQTVCLKIRSIGEAAKLAVRPNGIGFGPLRAGPQSRSPSPPIAPKLPIRIRQRGRREMAP
jgi:hypothetical protein